MRLPFSKRSLMGGAIVVIVIIGIAIAAVFVRQRMKVDEGFADFDYRREGPQPVVCGGIAGVTCPDGYECYYPPETEGVSDATGLCLQK